MKSVSQPDGRFLFKVNIMLVRLLKKSACILLAMSMCTFVLTSCKTNETTADIGTKESGETEAAEESTGSSKVGKKLAYKVTYYGDSLTGVYQYDSDANLEMSWYKSDDRYFFCIYDRQPSTTVSVSFVTDVVITGLDDCPLDSYVKDVDWKNNYKSLQEYSYTEEHYEGDNLITGKTVTDLFEETTENEYDGNGTLIHSQKKTVNSFGVTDSYKYDYDKNGNPVKIIEEIGNKDGVHTTKTLTYEYDEHNNKTSIVTDTVTANGKQSYTNTYKNEYDSNGNLIRYDNLGNGGSMIERYEYEYNDSGNVVKVLSYISSGNDVVKVGEETYEYDSFGNKTRYINDFQYLDTYKKTVASFEYDEDGNIAESSSVHYYGKDEYEGRREVPASVSKYYYTGDQ